MNTIMQTINNMYKSTPTLEETEIYKLESLLTQVGGNARSILLSAEEYTMADFIEICIRNGITFELRKNDGEKAGDIGVDAFPLSETAPSSNDNPSLIESPLDSKKPSETVCEEPQKGLTRVTLNNEDELLSVGDVVVAFDRRGNKTYKTVTDLGDEGYDSYGFMELDDVWVYLEDDNTCEEGREYYVER